MKGDELYKYTSQINFELSNICNRVREHPRCPLHFSKVAGGGKVILPASVVYNTLEDIKQYKQSGTVDVCYSIYNEPLIDPRLLSFINRTKHIMGEMGRPFVITNGTYLDQTMMDELAEAGLNILWVTSYSKEEEKEFKQLQVPEGLTYYVIPFAPLQVIDKTYTQSVTRYSKPCGAPLSVICIRCNGDVILCCRDFESHEVLGNVLQEKLSTIISKGRMHQIREQLQAGIRALDICSRCITSF
jgi:radical SAM protein with 4Fe4S-binding SPASM domain